MKDQIELNCLVAELCKVDPFLYQANLERGMKPTKAIARLKGDVQVAELVANLKVTYDPEVINAVYANKQLANSCMTGKAPGEFYVRNGVGLIYDNNSRTLVGETAGLSPVSYGQYGPRVQQLLRPHLERGVAGPGKHFVVTSTTESTFVASNDVTEVCVLLDEEGFVVGNMWPQGAQLGDTVDDYLLGPCTCAVRRMMIPERKLVEVQTKVPYLDLTGVGEVYLDFLHVQSLLQERPTYPGWAIWEDFSHIQL